MRRPCRQLDVSRRSAYSLAGACALAALACRAPDVSGTRQQEAAVPASTPVPAPLAASAEPLRAAGAHEVAFGQGKARFFVPKLTAAGERLPLVVLLHGLGATGEQTVQQLDIVAFADRERFVYVAPDGMQDPAGRRFWNAGATCCDFFKTGVDDSARLQQLIEHAVQQLPVDSRRVYVVGYSNGGFMAHRLACTHSEQVAAIVSIAGSGPLPPATCQPREAVAVLEIHGDRDAVVPMKGGHLFGRSELPKIAALRDSLEPWTKHNGCNSEVHSSEKLDLVPDVGGRETERAAFKECSKAPVELWTVQGGAHYLALHADALGHIWGFLAARSKK